MNRKEFFKNIFATAAFLALPTSFLLAEKNDKIKLKKQLHFVGLGGAGCNAIEFIQQQIPDAKYTCISHPARPNLPNEIQFVSCNQKHVKNVLVEMKIFHDLKNEQESIEPIHQVFYPNHTYILLAGLGQNTGSILSWYLFEKLKKENKEVYLVATTPFNFEGKKTKMVADVVEKKIKTDKHVSIISNEKIREEYGDMAIDVAFRKADELMIYKALELVTKNNSQSIFN